MAIAEVDAEKTEVRWYIVGSVIALVSWSSANAEDLRILGVGLGADNEITCTLELENDGLYACSDPERSLAIRADGAQAAKVMQVVRTQVLRSNDPSPSQIVRKALEFYGKPTHYDVGSLTVVYGDGFDKTGDDAIGPSGKGLAITVGSCRDYPIACGPVTGATEVVVYNLLDRSGRDALRLSHEQARANGNVVDRDNKLEGLEF